VRHRVSQTGNLNTNTVIMCIRIGTRASQLALAQAQWVSEQVSARYSGIKVDLVTITTKGDRVLERPLSTIGGKGLFVKEIEEALQRKEIDVAVHSLKDIPVELPDDLYIGVITQREDPYDVIISKNNISLENLAPGSKIGTSSLRRSAQLLHYRPDLKMIPLRGNLDTRIRKLQSLDIQAIVVASAGLRRIGFDTAATQSLPPDLMLPAIGQGALGLELRRDDHTIRDIISFLDHSSTRVAVEAERAFLKELKAGCQLPVAGLAKITGGCLSLDGLVASIDGSALFRDMMDGLPGKAIEIGVALARRLLDAGAQKILDDIYGKQGEQSQQVKDIE
jgi:hydroxymethylbilane synthase